jgi:hypothetical protein
MPFFVKHQLVSQYIYNDVSILEDQTTLLDSEKLIENKNLDFIS